MSQEKELVTETLQSLERNMELFYQQKQAEGLQEFQQALTKLMEMVDVLFAYQKEHDGFVMDEEKIKQSLTEAMDALEEGDFVLLADVIQYDFVEYIQGLMEQME